MIIMTRSIVTRICMFVAACGLANVSLTQELRVVTENFPPFHYLDNQKITGSVVDLLEPVLLELNLTTQNIEILPWARAYNLAENSKNTLIFSLVRFPAREPLFKWVAPVGNIKVGVFKLKSRDDIVIENTSDIPRYKSAVFINSAIEHFYEQEGFENFHAVGDYDSLVKMLMRGRIDIVPGSMHNFLSRVSALGFDLDSVEMVYEIKELQKGLWAAFNLETDDELVERVRDAIEKSRLENPIQAIPIK
jgi:polar amino acid transport system substrate-binding protein